ncbi:hypothetical protein [Sporolactobacillus sp. KGMB 08714]|uniref:hypothetical protein n=1 Tax=Sporolactobacillus sp. KGMB 08714 TaxID=3064704 RepID=UPI002FBEA5B3
MNNCRGRFRNRNDFCRRPADLRPSAAVQNEINLGRTGHYYRVGLAGSAEMLTIRLLSLNPATDRVGMNVYDPRSKQWTYYREHCSRILGMIDLGPEEPGTGREEGSPGMSAAATPQWFRPCAQFPALPWYR